MPCTAEAINSAAFIAEPSNLKGISHKELEIGTVPIHRHGRREKNRNQLPLIGTVDLLRFVVFHSPMRWQKECVLLALNRI